LLGAAIGALAIAPPSRAPSPRGGSAVAANADVYRDLHLFGEVFEIIRADYVDKTDDRKMVEAAVSGMLASLDPHSSYMDSKSYADAQADFSGAFGGLGIEVLQEDGLIKVIAPIDDTPASKAGVRSGDRISAINGKSLLGVPLDQAVAKMRGAVNTTVRLTLLRGERKEKVDLTLKRAVIQVKSVRSHLDSGDIGYIRINQFTEQTFDGLKDALAKIQREIPDDKLKGYVLDLRNNPGGLVDQSAAVVNAFIDHGEIVSTRGRNADDTQRYNARPIDLSRGKPLVVLINGGSASASEIVAGALQDHKRATLIGTRSFGKGSVQTIIPLGQSNGALRLTTARYYTPSGRSIQAKGVEPDIQILEDVPDALKGEDATEGEASLKGHLKNGDNEEHGSQAYVPTDEAKDKALHAAFDLLRGVRTAEALKVETPTSPATGAVASPADPAVNPAASRQKSN
jgi:carboxyl-terminal processing protease